jgi:2,3-diaminopropionate biosynthesis protein SbnA
VHERPSAHPVVAPWQRLAELAPQDLRRLTRRIGETPLETVRLTVGGQSSEVLLKLEGCNPGGSIKDRTALALVTSLETEGRLEVGDTIVESTSGNLGVALAFIARARGYRFHAVVDPHISAENLDMLRELGASIDLVSAVDETGNYLLSRLARVRELRDLPCAYVWTDQYGNDANPQAHYTTTAPEIDQQAGGRLDAVVIAVSTGGTLAGVSRYFRERKPDVFLAAADVVGSVALSGTPGRRQLSGIGSSQRSRFVGPDVYDSAISVTDRTAIACCHALWQSTGIKVGGSSGAALAATATLLRERRFERVVCVCPDDGRKYDASLFDNGWLNDRGLFPTSNDLPFDHIEMVRDVDWGIMAATHCGMPA